jgi:hypothetical protein
MRGGQGCPGLKRPPRGTCEHPDDNLSNLPADLLHHPLAHNAPGAIACILLEDAAVPIIMV